MITRAISMPHPVLGIDGDLKEGNFSVGFSIKSDTLTKRYLIEEFSINISNEYIRSLYDEGKVSLTLKISCIPTYKSWVFSNEEMVWIPENEVDQVIEIESFLVATKPIDPYAHSSFSDYFQGVNFQLAQGDIVGLTGPKRIPIIKTNEKLSLGSIFKFSRIEPEAEIQEMHFDFDGDEIKIYYPSLTNSDIDPVRFLFDKVQGLPYTALNLFLVPALTEAFRLIQLNKEEMEDYSDKKWFIGLDLLLPENDRSDDPFVNAQKAIKVGLPIDLAFEEIYNLKTYK